MRIIKTSQTTNRIYINYVKELSFLEKNLLKTGWSLSNVFCSALVLHQKLDVPNTLYALKCPSCKSLIPLPHPNITIK